MSSTLLPISSTGGFTTTASMIANAYALPDGQPATLEPYLTYNNASGNLNSTSTLQMIGTTAGFFVSATSSGNYNLWFNSAVRDADGNTYVVGGNQDNNNGSIWSFSSSGSIRWKTSVDQIVSGQNVRVEGVRFDTVNNRVVVTLEWYDGTSDQDGWLALNPADGTYDASLLLSTPPNSGPYVNDLAIDSAGEPIMVGQIQGEYVVTSGVAAQTGSATSVLWVNNSDLPIQVDPNNMPSWQIDTQPGGPANWVDAFNINQIPDLACETLTGTGSGALLQVTWSGVTNTYTNVYANQNGSGYAVGDRLRVRGSLLNGVDNTDITATATSASDVDLNTVAVFDKATYPTLGSVTTGWHAFFPSGLAYDVVGPAVDTGTTWEITVVSNGVDFSGPVMFTGAGNDFFVYVSYAAGYLAIQQLWECPSVQQVRFQINDAVDFATGGPWAVRYNLDGQAFIWTANWQHTYGTNDWQRFYSVSIDENTGDIYTLGQFYSYTGGVSRRINLMKLNSSGVTQWSKYVEDSNATSGNAGTVAVDGTGNVYVFAENDNGYATVTKLDSDGTLIWQSVQSNAAEWDNEIRGAVDSDGNAYISGVWYNGNDDVVSIIKLNSADGTLAWARFVENTENVSFREFYDNDTQPFTIADGKFIYAQYVNDVNNDYYDGFLMEMPTDGSRTGTYGRWIYTADNDAAFSDNTIDADVISNSNGVPVDVITQTPTGDSAAVTANAVGYNTTYTLNASTSGGGGIMFADGTVQTTAASGGSSPNSISNGTSSATIADSNGNLVINLNDGGALWTFTTNRDVIGRVNDNLVFVALDDGDTPQVRQEVRDLNDNTKSRTMLDYSSFDIEVDIGGTYGSWEFTNTQMSMPSDTDTSIRGYNSNIAIQAMYSGSHGTASLQSISNMNDPNIFSEFTATTTGANIAAYNGGSSGGTGHIWQFGNDGNLTLPANTFAVNYANGDQVQLGGGGTALPTNAPGYLRNDGVGALTWNTATVSAGAPAYSDVWVNSAKIDAFWTEYLLTGSVPMMYDWQGTSSLTLTGSALYGKQLVSGDKILVINDAPIHTNSTYAMVVEFPSTPATGDVFQIPFVSQGQLVTAGSFVIGQTYVIVQPGTTDFTAIGAADNNQNTVFTATGSGSGTGTANLSPGVLRTIFLPAAGQRGFTQAQGQSGRIEFGQGTSNIAVYNSVAGDMGSQPITWVYAGVIGGTPTWFQVYF